MSAFHLAKISCVMLLRMLKPFNELEGKLCCSIASVDGNEIKRDLKQFCVVDRRNLERK